MQWRFLIWLFFLGILNAPLSSYAQQINIAEDFQGLRLGMTYQEVQNFLKSKKVFIREEDPSPYYLSVPVYNFLGIYDTPENRFIDVHKQRIYYDNQVFFDLRNLSLDGKDYKFSYSKPNYIAEFPQIVAYKVAYASRINPLLYSLRVKFFRDRLYAVEYATELSFLQFNRLQNNYFRRYGRVLTPGNQTMETATAVVLVNVGQQNVTVIRVKKDIQKEIFSYLDAQTNDLIRNLYQYVETQLQEGRNAKRDILEDRKQKLRQGLREQFQHIDTL